MRTNIIEAIMGAIVLLIAGFFLVFAYTSSNRTLTDGYELVAKFDRVDGVVLGGDVRVSGVKVGSISDIEIDPKTYMAIIKMMIRSDVKLPVDTAAEIISESFMGGKYIALLPGGNTDFLADGQEITYTQSSVSWESLIGKFLFSKGETESSKNDASSPAPTP